MAKTDVGERICPYCEIMGQLSIERTITTTVHRLGGRSTHSETVMLCSNCDQKSSVELLTTDGKLSSNPHNLARQRINLKMRAVIDAKLVRNEALIKSASEELQDEIEASFNYVN